MSGDTPTIVATIALLGTLAGTLANFKAADKANRRAADLEVKKVDQAAYDRAVQIYDGIIDDLRSEIGRLQTLITDERKAWWRNREETRLRLEEAERTIAGLKGILARLEAFIREQGLILPPEIATRIDLKRGHMPVVGGEDGGLD